MLGMNSKRTLVSHHCGSGMPAQALRIQTGDLDERDKKEIQRNRRITKEVSILWK